MPMPAPCTQWHTRLKQQGMVQPSSSSLPSPILDPLASASHRHSPISADLPSSFLLTQGGPEAPLRPSSHNWNLWPPTAPHPTFISWPQGTVTLVPKVLKTPKSPGFATFQKAFPFPSLIPVMLKKLRIATLLQGGFCNFSILNVDFRKDLKYRERRRMVLSVGVNPGLRVTFLPWHNPCVWPPEVSSSLSYVK